MDEQDITVPTLANPGAAEIEAAKECALANFSLATKCAKECERLKAALIESDRLREEACKSEARALADVKWCNEWRTKCDQLTAENAKLTAILSEKIENNVRLTCEVKKLQEMMKPAALAEGGREC